MASSFGRSRGEQRRGPSISRGSEDFKLSSGYPLFQAINEQGGGLPGDATQAAFAYGGFAPGAYASYMADEMERAQIEDIVARSSAETGTKLANMETRMAEMSGKMDRLFDVIGNMKTDNSETRETVRALQSDIRSSRTTNLWATIGSALTVVAIVGSLIMGVPSWIGLGQHQHEVIQLEVTNAVAAAQTRQLQQNAPSLTLPPPASPNRAAKPSKG